MIQANNISLILNIRGDKTLTANKTLRATRYQPLCLQRFIIV